MLPSNEVVQRDEGLIVLLGDAIVSCETAKDQQKSWNTRILPACFETFRSKRINVPLYHAMPLHSLSFSVFH